MTLSNNLGELLSMLGLAAQAERDLPAALRRLADYDLAEAETLDGLTASESRCIRVELARRAEEDAEAEAKRMAGMVQEAQPQDVGHGDGGHSGGW